MASSIAVNCSIINTQLIIPMKKTSTRKRPFGVWVIIFLQLLSFGLFLSQIFVANPNFTMPGIPGVIESINLFLPIIFLSAYQGGLLVGLWFLRRWAWFLLMIQLGLGMAIQLLLYLNGTPPYLYMVFSVSMVFYLNQRDFQLAFERPSPEDELA
jgi:hypothetical protein